MKKDFTNNPAFEMLNNPAPAETAAEAPAKEAAPAKKAKAAKTFEPEKKETRSKQLLVLLRPSLLERLQNKAAKYELSTNELVNQILEQTV